MKLVCEAFALIENTVDKRVLLREAKTVLEQIEVEL